MSLRDPTTKQTGHFRPTRRAACFLAPLGGAAPRSTICVRYAIVAAYLMKAKNHAIATQPLLGQAPNAFDIPRSILGPPERTLSEHPPRLSAPRQLSNGVVKNAYKALGARKPNIYPRNPRNPRSYLRSAHLPTNHGDLDSIPNLTTWKPR